MEGRSACLSCALKAAVLFAHSHYAMSLVVVNFRMNLPLEVLASKRFFNQAVQGQVLHTVLQPACKPSGEPQHKCGSPQKLGAVYKTRR